MFVPLRQRERSRSSSSAKATRIPPDDGGGLRYSRAPKMSISIGRRPLDPIVAEIGGAEMAAAILAVSDDPAAISPW